MSDAGAGKHDFTIRQGDTFSRTITWRSGATLAAAQAATPNDLTGYSARMDIRARESSESAALSLTSGSGLTLGGAAGTVVITITATQAAALTAGRYVYDLEVESAGGVVTTLLSGRIVVARERTR